MNRSVEPLALIARGFRIVGGALLLGVAAAGHAQAVDAEVAETCAARPDNGALPVPAAGTAIGHDKSAAILGGAPSRFALMKAQQAAMTPAPVASMVSAPVNPAVAPPDCAAMVMPHPARPALATGGMAPFAPRAGNPDVFGSVAMAISRTPFDADWRKVRAGGMGAGAWSGVLNAARTQALADQLRLVNSWVNARIAFVDDAREYGVADHWASAVQSLTRGRGDCEDYAIAKLGLLRSLGIPAQDMYLVIARDLVRRADHAVLAVRLDGRLMVLDNQTDRILDAEEVQDYRPVMSYAADRSWTHGYRVKPDAMTAPLRTAAMGINAGR